MQVVWDAGSARGVLRLEGHRHFVQVKDACHFDSCDTLLQGEEAQGEEAQGCVHAHAQTPCCVCAGLRLGSSVPPAGDAVR